MFDQMQKPKKRKLFVPVIFILGIFLAMLLLGPRDVEDDYIDRCEELGDDWSYWNTEPFGPRCENQETREVFRF